MMIMGLPRFLLPGEKLKIAQGRIYITPEKSLHLAEKDRHAHICVFFGRQCIQEINRFELFDYFQDRTLPGLGGYSA